MAISLNGSTGEITGVSVGGLPDGIVDTDLLADGAVTAAKVGYKGFASYAIICDEKANDTAGGAFTSGDWRTRDLNTEIADPDGIVSISSNRFTLGAGSYLVEASAPAYHLNSHQLRLYNATDTSVVQYGGNAYATAGDNVQTHAFVVARLTITGSKAFEIQHRCMTSKTSNGMGVSINFGNANIYTVVKIYKEA